MTTATDTEMHCARHPKEETAITCATCGTPICPKCMVYTPVGVKCPDCGRNKKSTLYQVRPERLLLATITALAAGAIAALIGEIGFFVIFLSIPYGIFAGSMVVRASGMKRGTKLEIITGAGIVLGAIAFKVLPGMILAQHIAGGGLHIAFGLRALIDPFLWIAVVLSTSAAVSKVRNL